MLWEGGIDPLRAFIQHLHRVQSALTFTAQWDKQSITFLDLIKHEDGILITSLYRKPTDKNSLLQYRSFHPQALRDGLPFGQFEDMQKLYQEGLF